PKYFWPAVSHGPRGLCALPSRRASLFGAWRLDKGGCSDRFRPRLCEVRQAYPCGTYRWRKEFLRPFELTHRLRENRGQRQKKRPAGCAPGRGFIAEQKKRPCEGGQSSHRGRHMSTTSIDVELLISRLAAPLSPPDRAAFRAAAEDALARVPCWGEGAVYRAVASLQRQYFS